MRQVLSHKKWHENTLDTQTATMLKTPTIETGEHGHSGSSAIEIAAQFN